MGKIRYLLGAMCGLATLASCNGDCEIPLPVDNAIRFDNRIGEPYVEDLTRGMMTDNTNFSEFGVFAYYSAPGSKYDSITSAPDYMFNVHVTRVQQGPWNYTPQKFWPTGSVSFFAYTPHTDTKTNVSVECKFGAPVVTYTVPDNVADHCDLMLSAPALKQKKGTSGTLLTFKHALACIDFNARVSDTLVEGQSIKVITVKLEGFLNKATCYHHESEGIKQTFTTDAVNQAYTLSEATGTLINPVQTNKKQSITSATGNLMLWPQAIDSANKLTITTEYTSDNKTRTIVFESSIPNSITEIKAGKRYTFNLLFSGFGDMTLTCAVADWKIKVINVPEFN